MDLFTADVHSVHTSDERSQLEAFLDTYRRLINESLDGVTEQEARRRLVPSRTTLLGLVKHATYVEQVWFVEAVTGTPRQELGLPASPDDSFLLGDDDTIATVREAHRRACADSVETASHLALDDVFTGHWLGSLNLRWIYLHLVRELAQHAGHADILREQVVAERPTSSRGVLEEPVVEQ